MCCGQADAVALLAEVATCVSQTVAPAGWSGVWQRLERAARGVVQGVGGDFFEGDVLSAVVETFVSTTGGFGPIDPVPGDVFGLVTVTYEFTPIPEPSTGVLFGLGVAVTAGLRRAR